MSQNKQTSFLNFISPPFPYFWLDFNPMFSSIVFVQSALIQLILIWSIQPSLLLEFVHYISLFQHVSFCNFQLSTFPCLRRFECNTQMVERLSFDRDLISGSIEKIVIRNVTAGSPVTILSTFIVPDVFNAKTFQVTLPFPDVRKTLYT